MDEALMVSMLDEYARTKDNRVRDTLLEAFLPLANSIARRFAGRGAEVEDLQQVAAMALLKALERFQPERGYRFVTYPMPTITGDVRNYLRDKAGTIRMPRDARQKLFQMRQEQERFSREHLREPTAKELAKAMDITPDELLMLLNVRAQNDVMSLDEQINSGENEFAAFLGQKDAGFERMEDNDWMRWIFSKVNDSERKLLRLRYQEQLGQRETAKRLGVSQMQVSRMERKILSRLRAIEQNGA